MLPYAETLLEQAESNQWFIRFYESDQNATQQDIMSWFGSQGLQLTHVRTQQYDAECTHFYHVNFASDSDVRLKAYSDRFEDAHGVSLQPDVYQLYEWSYSAWCAHGLREAWITHKQTVVDTL